MKEAVESSNVVSGDTIYVEASGTPYEGGIEIFKRLTIIGPGYLKSGPQIIVKPDRQLTATINATSSLVGIALFEGSDGTTVTGLTIGIDPFDDSIRLRNTSNITIERNHLGKVEFISVSSATNFCSDIVFTKNLICDAILFRGGTSTSGVVISNNLIRGNVGFFSGESNRFVSDGLIEFNTLRNSSIIWINGCKIENNYVGTIESSTDNLDIQNNILDSDNSDNQEVVAAYSSNVIDSYDDSAFSCANTNWTLPSFDQTPDHGAYNGLCPFYSDDPFSFANGPRIPFLYDSEVQSCGDSTIQVILRVRSNN